MKIIDDKYFDCYVYGLEILILSILGIINIVIAGILTNTLPNAVFFLITFIFLRQYTGGYHADSVKKCNLYFLTAYLLNIFISYHFSFQIFCLTGITLFFGVGVIYFQGPVVNHKKDISGTNLVENKINALKIYLLLISFSTVYSFFYKSIAITINIAMLECVILMLVSKMTNT